MEICPMTSPTKGPWTYNRLGNIRSPKHVLAQMPPNLYFVEGMTEAEIDANGYLMAASWEMFELLKYLQHAGDFPDLSAKITALLDKIENHK